MTDLSVMTWNVENLFEPASESDRPRYQEKLQLLATHIDSSGPDVVALQELGGTKPLQDLQQQLHGSYPHRAISNFPDRRGIRVGFLSKLPLADAHHVVQFPAGPALQIQGVNANGGPTTVTRMSRGALQVRVTKDGSSFHMVTTHLKSKLLEFPRPNGQTSFTPRDETERMQVAGCALHLRTAEAGTLRNSANSLLEPPHRLPLIVLGDFNDEPAAQTSLILCGPPGSEIGTPGFPRHDAGDPVRLFNLALAIDPTRRFSRRYHDRGEMIDLIYASVDFFAVDGSGKRQPPAAGDVDSHIELIQGQSVGDDPNTRAHSVAPDHAPVMARLHLP